MIDITFKLNNTDYSTLLSTYTVDLAVEVTDTATTLDGTEYAAQRYRPQIIFTLIPLTDAQTASLYSILSTGLVEVTYKNPNFSSNVTALMRVASPLDSIFGLKSVTGDRYYKGNEITLRQRSTL